jgi:hypothetical protein
MSIKNFFLITFWQWVAFTLLKVVFFKYEILSDPNWQKYLFWVLSAVVAAAMVRRLGVINYLEAFFLVLVWTLGNLFGDLLITAAFVGYGMLAHMEYWGGVIAMALAIVLFHKKRHIHVRHELHAKHHH